MREAQEGCPLPLKSIVFETLKEFQKLRHRVEKVFFDTMWPPSESIRGGPFLLVIQFSTNTVQLRRPKRQAWLYSSNQRSILLPLMLPPQSAAVAMP